MTKINNIMCFICISNVFVLNAVQQLWAYFSSLKNSSQRDHFCCSCFCIHMQHVYKQHYIMYCLCMYFAPSCHVIVQVLFHVVNAPIEQ